MKISEIIPKTNESVCKYPSAGIIAQNEGPQKKLEDGKEILYNAEAELPEAVKAGAPLEAFGTGGGKDEADYWIDKLHDPNAGAEEQIEAIKKLGRMGRKAKKAVANITNYFLSKENYFLARAEAARAMGKIIPAFVDDMKNESTCSKAMGTLYGVVEALGMAITSFDPHTQKYAEQECVRQTAAEALYDIGEALVPALIEIMNWDDDEIRENKNKRQIKFAAAEVFNKIADIAVSALGDTSAKVQDCAIRALSSIGQPALPKVRQALGDMGSANTRLGAVKVCYYMGADAHDALPELIDRLSDRSAKVANGAVNAILKMGQAAVPDLLKNIYVQRVSMRQAIVVILGDMAGKEISEKTTQEIMLTLCKILLSDCISQIRTNAAESLKKWIGKAEKNFGVLICIFETQKAETAQDLDLITAVAKAMIIVRPQMAENYLSRKLSDTTENIKRRRVAACALGEMGSRISPKVVDYIVENILVEKRGRMICLDRNKVDHFLLCATITALGKIGAAAKSAIPRLNKILEQARQKIADIGYMKYITPKQYEKEKSFLEEIIWRTKETLEQINQ